MGGKAIKIAERVKRDKFFLYSKEIIPRVEKAFGTKVSMVQSFHDKEDFGDLDLLVLADRDFGNRREIIENEFSPKEINTNAHIVSFNYNELQVDLIFTTPDKWESSKIFFNHGDLGNFMGKLINNYGNLPSTYRLKYGFDGLKCNVLIEGKSKTLFLTKDNKEVFDFLGLEFSQWEKGFKNKEEMFDYVISSPFFDYDSFQWETQNAINRDRNKRRPNYIKFLEYIKPFSKKKNNWDKDYTKYLKILSSYFGANIIKFKSEFEKEIDIEKQISKKFNGNIIMDNYPLLRGEELGLAIAKFKESKEDFNTYILNTKQEDIIKEFGLFTSKNF